MSIYATLWTLKFPKEGDEHLACDWIEVTAQAVPPHIGSPTPGCGYEAGDPYATFLPPPVQTDAEGCAPVDRAVVFVTEHTLKGTPRRGQEYASPLLALTGKEYARIPFGELHRRLCDALRQPRQGCRGGAGARHPQDHPGARWPVTPSRSLRSYGVNYNIHAIDLVTGPSLAATVIAGMWRSAARSSRQS